YPKAALFVFCLALLAANAVAVLKAAARAVHGEEKADELSGYYLALEIKQVHEGMMIALPSSRWKVFSRMTPAEFRRHIERNCRPRRSQALSQDSARPQEARTEEIALPKRRPCIDLQTT